MSDVLLGTGKNGSFVGTPSGCEMEIYSRQGSHTDTQTCEPAHSKAHAQKTFLSQ